jgi:predicted TIM-barrel fold metal-dependent hydrolase
VNYSRRRFITRSALAGVGCATYGLSAGATAQSATTNDRLPIIDTHQHLWDYDRFRPPWLSNAPKILAQRYATAEYLAATRGLNVVKAVYMEVDVDPKQQVEEALHVIELSKSDEHPTVGAVISGRPNAENFANYINQFKDSRYIKGVRQVIQVDSTPAGFCLQPQFGKSMDLLGRIGKSFDICIRPSELGDALKLVRRHPDTQFILDHCGNADPKAFASSSQQTTEPQHAKNQWLKDIGELATCDNLVCKISGIVARAPKNWKSEQLAPIINHCLDEFGPDRVVFGGDWPVCLLGASYQQWVEALREIIAERSRDEQKKLLHDNAVKLYRLT